VAQPITLVPVCLQFCQDTRADPATHAYSLIGLLPGLRVPSLPTTGYVALTVYAAVTDGHGEGTLELRLFEPDDAGMPGPAIYAQSRWVAFADPIGVYHVEFRVRKLYLRRPGAHLVRLSFDGHPITERVLQVQTGADNT
jgi:hypothetical protein